MVFNSFEFAVFFCIVLGLYWILKHRWQNAMLLAASYVFYGFWDWRFLSLIIFSTVLDYFCGLALHRRTDPRERKQILTLSLLGNLGVLGVFKYYNFFAGNLEALLNALGIETASYVYNIILPVGVSFYTFQTLSYTLDIYRRRMEPTRSFPDFALFVAFFPQLVAGPIERARRLLPQLQAPRRFDAAQFGGGVWLVYWGLFKKVFIADNVARIVDPVYADPGAYTTFHLLVATYAFAVQIYCDFSGYTDIARGVARMLGMELTLNFNLPYFAKNPQDFWRRWHISLSEWLRDYLYIPLGGGQGRRRRVLRNLMLTMALGGLWHGAAWPFVLWGLYHGLLLVLYRLAGEGPGSDAGATRRQNACRIFLMFHFVCFGWMLFRAESLADIGAIFGTLREYWLLPAEAWLDLLRLAGYSLILVWMQTAQYRTGDLMAKDRWPVWKRAALYVILYLCIALGGQFDGREFIYFQF